MWSETVTTVPPSARAVTAEEAKEFLSVDHSDHDTLIETFIDAAIARGEATTGTRFGQQTIELHAGAWSDLSAFPVGPIATIDALVYENTGGFEVTVSSGTYELFGSGLSRGLRLLPGQIWPSDMRNVSDSIRVTATAGYQDIPKSLIAAILLMTGDLYANRETVVVGSNASQIPMSMQVETLLNQHRIWL